jgi:rhodanese-related sulfurtransferase
MGLNSRYRLRKAVPLLLLAALIPALLSAWLHPCRPLWQKSAKVGEVSVASVRSRADVVWVDARSEAAFAVGHIPGAISLPLDGWTGHVEAVVSAWKPGVTVVVYCDAATCAASQSVARRLRDELGLDEVYVLSGGLQKWQEAAR